LRMPELSNWAVRAASQGWDMDLKCGMGNGECGIARRR
jgi:hypothetical protein